VRPAAAALALAAALPLASCTMRPQRWVPPPKGPSLPPDAAAAVFKEFPDCPRERVYADQFSKLIQASGCGRVVYLTRRAALLTKEEEEGDTWARAADFPLPPANDLRSAEGLLAGARLRSPVLVAGKDPLITLEQAKTLHSWSPVAVVTCVLGVDGLLHACYVQADEPLVAEAVKKTLSAIKYHPATADANPVPATFQITIHVPVPRPNCTALADPIRERRCRAALDSPEGPAAATGYDPDIWGLPLGH
jgi:hypothetical protein